MFEVDTTDTDEPDKKYAALRHWPLGASREELNDDWKNLPADQSKKMREQINRYAHVYVLCVSEDVQKEHSLNVGMMKMEELRQAFILS